MTSAPLPKRPGGPRGHWFWGSIRELQEDPLGLLRRGFAEHGEVIAYRMGPLRVTYFTHPDHVKHILVDRASVYGRSKLLRGTGPLLGQGLITSDGELWKRQRRLAQPAFHRERLAALVEQMVQVTQNHLRHWDTLPDGSVLDLYEEMVRLVLSITARTLFSTQVTREAEELFAAINIAVFETNARLLSINPLRPLLPSRANREFARAMETLNRAVFGIIDAHRRASQPSEDLLQMLLEARDQDTGEAMSDQQLRDEVVTIIMAGYETTANALAWTWSLLGRHPEAMQKLRAEVDAVLGGRAPTAQDVPKLRYTAMVIEESMRLYPTVWSFPRQAVADDVLGGYQVRKGDLIALSPYLTHRHPAFWEEPERFDPERFTPERAAGRPKLAYLPFGAGQRMCIGTNFALMEMPVILAMITQRYRQSIASDRLPTPVPSINLRPDTVPMRLHRLAPAT